MTADGELDNKSWDKVAKFEIRNGAALEPVPEPDPPTVVSAEITSPNKVTITFSEKVNAPQSAFSDFTVTGEDESRKILARNGNNSDTITLTIGGSPLPINATGTIDISDKVKSKAGVKLTPLVDHPVADGQADPPQTEDQSGIIDGLRKMIADLEKKVTGLTDMITGLTTQTENLTTQVETMTTRVEKLEQQVEDDWEPLHWRVSTNHEMFEMPEIDATNMRKSGGYNYMAGTFPTISIPYNGTTLYPFEERIQMRDGHGAYSVDCVRYYPYDEETFYKFKTWERKSGATGSGFDVKHNFGDWEDYYKYNNTACARNASISIDGDSNYRYESTYWRADGKHMKAVLTMAYEHPNGQTMIKLVWDGDNRTWERSFADWPRNGWG